MLKPVALNDMVTYDQYQKQILQGRFQCFQMVVNSVISVVLNREKQGIPVC